MTEILFPVALVAGIGLVLGLGLAIASKIMAVPVDEKAEAITEALPGANCGACGYSGCSGYAAALSSGKETATNLCAPGGSDAAKKVAEIMGTSPAFVLPTAAGVAKHRSFRNAERQHMYKPG